MYQIVDNPNKKRYDIINTNTGEVVGFEYYSRTKGQAGLASKSLRKQKAMDAAERTKARLQVKDTTEAEVTPAGITKTELGNYTSEKTGESYSSLEEAIQAEKEFDRRQGLEENVEKFEARIKEAGRLREDLAERTTARQQGQLLNQLQRSILGAGGEQGQVEALTPGIQEGSQRALQDLLTGSQAKTQEQLATFVPTEIRADYNQANLSQAMQQFLIGEETDRARVQAGFDQQPEWWEQMLGQGAGTLGSSLGQVAGSGLLKLITGGVG
jgi:hypothetical protein